MHKAQGFQAQSWMLVTRTCHRQLHESTQMRLQPLPIQRRGQYAQHCKYHTLSLDHTSQRGGVDIAALSLAQLAHGSRHDISSVFHERRSQAALALLLWGCIHQRHRAQIETRVRECTAATGHHRLEQPVKARDHI